MSYSNRQETRTGHIYTGQIYCSSMQDFTKASIQDDPLSWVSYFYNI